jgi:hypothetical protein
MHSVSQSPADLRVASPKTSGEKVVIKAITAIINREGKKKTPVKRVDLPLSGSLWA